MPQGARAVGADSALPPGSEVKTMLSKLKGQLEEMKSKVQFLGLVKKYLQASRPACLHPSLGWLSYHSSLENPL